MESFIIGIFMFMGYLMLYSIINRICTCIEHCSTVRAYGKAIGNNKEFKKQIDSVLEGKTTKED